jgi:demethylmenaquinone methyltransferase/2-methoxy-6-polyprenyl-1,4-benzoquinol methylase
MITTGAKPQGAEDEASAAQAVRQMFDAIAPRYDLLNHILSMNVDRLWWRRAARRFRTVLANPDAAVLDICCGTGDLTTALLKHRPRGARPILAADFAREMLSRAARKFDARKFRARKLNARKAGADEAGAPIAGLPYAALGRPYAVPLEADALHLPLKSGSLDLIVTAFGFRNLANYEAGLREFHRVLKPGGQLGILEFSEPGGLVGKAYAVYFRRVLPAIGRLVCGPVAGRPVAGGKAGPYNYLPSSVGNFPLPQEMVVLMRGTGYEDCAWQPYTLGIAGLYTGKRGL